MPRMRRNAPGGLVYHVLNRGVGRRTLFHKDEDYAAFERVLADVHLLLALRYVERNALRANVVSRAEDWTWGSLWRRQHQRGTALLAPWPIERPADWNQFVNEPQTPAELEAIRRSVNRGCPFGDDDWQAAMVTQLGLESTLRPPGRPKRVATEEVL